MSHTFLALDMNLIPKSTKKFVPKFEKGFFSNDGIKDADGNWLKDSNGDWISFPSKMLIDGYNAERKLVHSQAVLNAWLQWESNAEEIQEQLLTTAIEYTAEQIKTERKDPNSIWYIEPEALI